MGALTAAHMSNLIPDLSGGLGAFQAALAFMPVWLSVERLDEILSAKSNLIDIEGRNLVFKLTSWRNAPY